MSQPIWECGRGRIRAHGLLYVWATFSSCMGTWHRLKWSVMHNLLLFSVVITRLWVVKRCPLVLQREFDRESSSSSRRHPDKTVPAIRRMTIHHACPPAGWDWTISSLSQQLCAIFLTTSPSSSYMAMHFEQFFSFPYCFVFQVSELWKLKEAQASSSPGSWFWKIT